MTPAQSQLLRDLINADRRYWKKVVANEPVHRDERGIELGWSCHPGTARALVTAGVAEIVDIRPNQNYIFLGSYDPMEVIES